MKLTIGMVTGGLKFSGDALDKQSLGGSETAFLCMARELAKRGHKVTVWVNTDVPGVYDGVQYLPIQTFESFAPTSSFDVLIASRWPEFLARPTRANLRILWLHDTLTDKERLMGASWQTDEFWLLSDYHIQDYCGDLSVEPGEDNPKLPELYPHIWKTSNGVDLDLIQANIRPKVPGKVIYTSRPERGLHHLLQMVPEIAKNVPGFKLYYANYALAGMQLPEHVVQINAICDQLAKHLGPDLVQPLGHLTKAELYQHVSSSQLQLYPTSFPEISCCAEGTYVQLPCDRAKYPHGVPIEELVGKENFPVYAYDVEAGNFVLANCSKVWKTGEDRECVDIALDDGNVLTVTPEHLVMDFDGNWHRADALTPGMRLNALHLRYNARQNHKVLSVTKSKKTYTVYDMTVDVHHNFVANGVVVHNCIAAMEAQACGTPIVATDDFALRETVVNHKTGVLIPGRPDEKSYVEQFIAKTVRLLQKPEVLAGYALRAKASIVERGYTWEQVAESWEDRIMHLFEQRSQERRKVVDRLVFNGDLQAAVELTDDPEVAKLTSKVTDRVVQPEEVPSYLQRELPVYQRLLSLMGQEENFAPKTLMEICTNPAPFSFAFKQHADSVKATVVALPEHKQLVEEVAARMAKTGDIDIPFSYPNDEKFDLVVLNRTLDYFSNPVQTIRDVLPNLNPGGYIAFITGMGPNSHTLRDRKHDRLWSFDSRDLRALFPDGLQAAFQPEWQEVVGGSWVGLVKIEDPANYVINWNRDEAIARRALVTRPYRSIGASMIVKNEEDNIVKCLKAVRPYVDKLVVADTGSTDGTKSLCILHGVDELREIEFDNFSQARNASKEGLDTDWYLWLDADEQLLGGENLRKYSDSTIYNGMVVRQCVTGDTLVSLPGRNVQIKDLVGQTNFPCWSYSEEEGKMVLSNVRSVAKTGTRKVVEVVMDEGVIRCTPDHPVMLRDGSYRPAGSLQPGDSLMPFYRCLYTPKGKGRDGRHRRAEWWVHLNNGDTVKEHRYVYEQLNGTLPKGFVVHHENGDHLDNQPANLRAMAWGEHTALHRRGKKFPQEFRLKQQETAWEQHGSVCTSREEMLALIDAHRGNMTSAMRDLGISQAGFYHRLQRLDIDLADVRKKWPTNAAGRPRKRPRVKPILPNNHKVLEVRDGGVEDVFDMEVDVTHNFVANGVVVHNCHMMIDLHGTFDTPIRLLRNKPEYRFTGLIHEHCEDTSRGPFGHGIRPAIVAQDLDLAHYGYPTEGIRRKKCSNRNMDLLIRDLKENPDREINKLLFMRDCLNICKWHLSAGQPIVKFSYHHALLNTALALFYKHFDDPKNRYYKMTDPMAQEAMRILMACGLPFEDRKSAPFEVALTLAAAMGKPVETKDLKPSTRLFVDTDQFHRYMEHKLADLEVGLGDPKEGKEELLASRGKTRFMTDTVAAIELLRAGANRFS